MWERKAKKATWNGIAINILQTTLDNGKRLHVAEMPYQDDPHIKVMGAKSKSISIEVVFVGVNSLVDANAFVAELGRNPEGELEHPYLGELSLVFDSSSQSISTKKGLVTLTVKFLQQGTQVTLVRIDEKSVGQLITVASEESNQQFVKDVEQATPEQIDSMQFDFNTLLNTLRNIANRSASSSYKLARLHRQIEDAFTAVEMIKHSPENLSGHLNAIVNSLKNVIDDDKQSESDSGYQRYNSSEMASEKLSKVINPDAEFTHCNNQITLAVILLSDELDLLSHDEQFNLDIFIEYPLIKVERNIKAIQSLLNDLVIDVTRAATFESLALVDAVEALQENVNNKANKLMQFQQSLKQIEVVSSRPLLCIAQSNECDADELHVLNNISHPLFVTGFLQVANA